MNSSEPVSAFGWHADWEQSLMANYATPAIMLVRGQGSRVWDDTGKEYVDLIAGIAVSTLGHADPRLASALNEQMNTLGHVSNLYAHPLAIDVAQRLGRILQWEDARTFFCNSGAEANEAALKISRLSGRTHTVVAEGGFHGRTMGALSWTAQPAKQDPFRPLPGDVSVVPYGDVEALTLAVTDQTAAIVLEPIQGEAGAIVPPDNYWPRLREICSRYGVLLIADEVQTGFGRTGKIFGVDHWGVAPDIICFGKALGGGVVPMSGFFSSAEIWSCLEPNPFMHTTTTGGNPLACAAALAGIRVMLEENLPQQAAEKGDYLLQKIGMLRNKYPHILKDIRGKGLLLAMVFENDEIGYKVVSGLFKRHVLTSGTLNNSSVVRLEPALNIPYELLDEVLVRLEDTLKSVSESA